MVLLQQYSTHCMRFESSTAGKTVTKVPCCDILHYLPEGTCCHTNFEINLQILNNWCRNCVKKGRGIKMNRASLSGWSTSISLPPDRCDLALACSASLIHCKNMSQAWQPDSGSDPRISGTKGLEFPKILST